MRADPGLAEDTLAHRNKFGARGVDVGHFETDMMLSPPRVFGEETVDGRVSAERFDQLDLRAVRGVDEADFHTLRGQIERLVDFGRAHDIAPEGNAVSDRRRRNADMVEANEVQADCPRRVGCVASRIN